MSRPCVVFNSAAAATHVVPCAALFLRAPCAPSQPQERYAWPAESAPQSLSWLRYAAPLRSSFSVIHAPRFFPSALRAITNLKRAPPRPCACAGTS